jgi:hypothetical protein
LAHDFAIDVHILGDVGDGVTNFLQDVGRHRRFAAPGLATGRLESFPTAFEPVRFVGFIGGGRFEFLI